MLRLSQQRGVRRPLLLPVAFRGWRGFASTNAPESSPTTGALARSEVVSVDRCDRDCGRRPVAWFERGKGDEWALCAVHAAQHEAKLKAAGWELWIDAREVDEAQPSGAV